MKYRSKETVEAITFEEFVEIGIASYKERREGVPWSFEYQGANVTHERDDLYIISGEDPGGELFSIKFERGHFLVTASDGDMFVMHEEWFHEKYDSWEVPNWKEEDPMGTPDCWLTEREEEDPDGNVYVITPESDLEAIKRAMEP